MNGKVCAVERQTGKRTWKASLPGWYVVVFVRAVVFLLLLCANHYCSGYGLVTVGNSNNPNALVCGSAGKLYGVSRADGGVLWIDSMYPSTLSTSLQMPSHSDVMGHLLQAT